MGIRLSLTFIFSFIFPLSFSLPNCHYLTVCNRILRQFLTNSRKLWNFKITVLCSIIIFTQIDIVLNQSTRMKFVNHKVRDHSL